jgi:hypothetical protein
MPEPFNDADPTVTPATENEIIPVGTMPPCVLTATVSATDCDWVIMLGESPRVTTGVFFATAFTVSEAAFELPEA